MSVRLVRPSRAFGLQTRSQLLSPRAPPLALQATAFEELFSQRNVGAFFGMEITMAQRRRIKQVTSLESRLAREAARLREEAKVLPPGVEREHLLKKARQCETGSHLSEWLRAPGMQPQDFAE